MAKKKKLTPAEKQRRYREKRRFSLCKNSTFFLRWAFVPIQTKNNFYLFSHLIYDLGFHNATWSFFEASHGKGAPDGVGGALKRLANNVVAHGNNIEDAESLFHVLSKNSTVKMFYINDEDIEDISHSLPQKVPLIKGTRMIHQVCTSEKGKLSHRKVSCFCVNNSWDTGKLCNCTFPQTNFSFLPGKSTKNKELKKKSVYHEIYSSESDDEIFSVKDTTDDDDDDDIDLQNIISSEDELSLLEPVVAKIKQGTHVLVEFLGGLRKATKYRYVAVCQGPVEEDGEVKVTCFLNVVSNGKIFKVNENDTSYIEFEQILGILPNPKIIMKGQRVLYEFKKKIDVFERG